MSYNIHMVGRQGPGALPFGRSFKVSEISTVIGGLKDCNASAVRVANPLFRYVSDTICKAVWSRDVWDGRILVKVSRNSCGVIELCGRVIMEGPNGIS